MTQAPTSTKTEVSTCCQQADPLTFQDSTGQPPREVSSGIDIDPVGTNLRLFRGRMPVHNDLTEVRLTQQKFIADPQEILFILLRERDIRTHASVTQKIPLQCQRRFERGEKVTVCWRKRGAKRRSGCLVTSPLHHRPHIDPIGVQCFEPAHAAPNLADRRIDEKLLKYRFMVALERHKPGRKRIVRQPLNDLSRVGPAIYVVAQSDSEAIGRCGSLQITRNGADHALQEVRSTVDIANNINPARSWRHRDPSEAENDGG